MLSTRTELFCLTVSLFMLYQQCNAYAYHVSSIYHLQYIMSHCVACIQNTILHHTQIILVLCICSDERRDPDCMHSQKRDTSITTFLLEIAFQIQLRMVICPYMILRTAKQRCTNTSISIGTSLIPIHTSSISEYWYW